MDVKYISKCKPVLFLMWLLPVYILPASTLSSAMAFHSSVNKTQHLITVYKALQDIDFFLLPFGPHFYPCPRWSQYAPATTVIFLFFNTPRPFPPQGLYLQSFSLENSKYVWDLLPHFHVFILMSLYQRGIPWSTNLK